MAARAREAAWRAAEPRRRFGTSATRSRRTPTGAERYRRWRGCVEAARPKQFALPLGDVKAPETGWLVIAGRRGHYEFCDTVRAYDLVTGAAFIDDSCCEITFELGWPIDRDMHHRGMARRVKAGVVPVENLRETLWMLLLRSEAEEVQRSPSTIPVPAGVTPQAMVRRRDDDDFGGVGCVEPYGAT